MRKVLIILGLSMCFLLVCWGIGSITHPSKYADSDREQESQDSMAHFESQGYENVGTWEWDGHNIEFENVKTTSENPWGFTAGMIDTDSDGKCVLLTPGTGVTLGGIAKDSYSDGLMLQLMIHPWVASGSDGAGVSVLYVDDQGQIIKREEWEISNEDDWQRYVLDFSLVENVTRIKLLCGSGKNNDENADWVIIK